MEPNDEKGLRESAKRHYWPIFGRGSAYIGDPSQAPIVADARGSYVYDIDGNAYLDVTGAQATSSIGYANERVSTVLEGRLRGMQANGSTFPLHVPAIRLAERIARLAPPGFNKVFFAVNGTDANETAIKMVRQYFRIKNQAAKREIVVRWRGYHGSSIVTGAASGNTPRRRFATPLPDGFIHIEPPHHPGCVIDERTGECDLVCANDVARVVERHHPSNVGAFLGEPTIGAGGVIPAPPGYWRRIRDICDQNEMLLVFDEVITGFGRVGRWFESEIHNEKEGVLPDIITFGKGVTGGYYPLSGAIVRDEVAAAFDESGQLLNHGYTFGATPFGCEAALATIDVLEEEVLPEVPAKAERLRERLEGLASRSKVVDTIRFRGLMAGIDLMRDRPAGLTFSDDEKVRRFLAHKALKAGLLMVQSGRTINVIPPLTITFEEIDDMVDRMEGLLKDLEDAVAGGVLT